MKNLNKEIQGINNRSMSGLINATIIVRRDMEFTPPLIPIDTGNLRASYFTSPYHTSKGPAIQYGFSANYAIHVHEMIEAKFKRPGAGAKFFEAAIKRNIEAMLDEIRKEAKIK